MRWGLIGALLGAVAGAVGTGAVALAMAASAPPSFTVAQIALECSKAPAAKPPFDPHWRRLCERAYAKGENFEIETLGPEITRQYKAGYKSGHKDGLVEGKGDLAAEKQKSRSEGFFAGYDVAVSYLTGQPLSDSSSTTPAVPAGATALCNDQTYSYSAHHQGSCSYHGGVAVFYT